ncbi:MAG: tetratricopeptide repeat protein, partial [Pseudomonadota bacterium]
MTGFSRTGPAPLSLGRRLRWVGLAVVAAVALAACEDPTERAERHYQSAVSLIAEGKVELALVELRRVFDYDGRHREARLLYASTQMERGQTQEAYSQYLRLIEQFPNTLVARLALAETAFDTGNWDEFSRHGGAVITLATAPTPQSTTDPAEGSAGSAAPDLSTADLSTADGDTVGGDTANGEASDEQATDAGEETDTPAPDLSAPLVLDPALDPDTADAVAAIAAALA